MESKGITGMTKEVRRKVFEIGAGLLLYLIAFGATAYLPIVGYIETALFLMAYVVIAATVYREKFFSAAGKHLLDENLLIIIATAGAFCIGRYNEAVAAMLFYQAGKLIEKIALSRTKKAIADFIDIRPEYANVREGMKERVISPQELKLKQTIILKPGEKIPVDAIVTQGTGTVDMKALTGEAEPKAVHPGDRLYGGSINLNSVLEAKVVRQYNDSAAAKVLRLVKDAGEKKTENLCFADKFNKYYTPVAILIAIFTMILPPMIFSEAYTEWVYRGLLILVVSCPCSLMVSIPLAYLGGIGAASKQGVLIRNGTLFEQLVQADTFVFDKTGTLTEGVFHVREIVPFQIEPAELLELAALAESHSTHPSAVSILEAYKGNMDISRVRDIKEEPGYGVRAIVDGKEVFAGNTRLMNRQGIFYQPVYGDGEAVHISLDGRYVGYILISDEIRKDAGILIRWLQKKHFTTIMLTGDNEKAAEAVASALKIDSVYAELMPEEKIELIREFSEDQMENEKLVFVGDGINDAPVLAGADIGIAMGGFGTGAALEAADIILMEDEPSKIINVVRIAKATLRSVKQNMILSIGMKIILVVLGFLGFITMQNAILADMTVMLINILNSFWILHYPEY